MGSTLTHGVYLPDEGERNCYNGLAANWQLLDNSVGTIADHTTALAGKAPAVHTHTKSDITDLFNSANTWSGLNTFQGGGIRVKDTAALSAGEYGAAIYFQDYQGNRYGYIQTYVTSDNYKNIIIGADGTGRIQLNSYLVPYAANAVNFGTSDLQWKSVYAQSYYYNGVAWGLDKVNTWSAQQKIIGNNTRGTISIYNPAYTKGGALSSTDLSIGSIYMGDGGQQGLANSLSFISTDLAANGAKTLLSLSAMENTASSGTRTNVVIQYDKNDVDNPKKMSVGGALIPNPDATFPLGTSSFRWKSFNGINPGALSLPDTLGTSGTENVNYFNIIGYLNNTGTLATIPATATYDGWLYINAKDGADSYITVDDYPSGFGTSVFGNNGLGSSSVGLLCLICPIRKGHAYNVRIKSAGIVSARIYPAQGNV